MFIEWTSELYYGDTINLLTKMSVAPFDDYQNSGEVTHFTSNFGGMGFFKTLKKDEFDILASLERFLTREFPHHCGLNPRAYQ